MAWWKFWRSPVPIPKADLLTPLAESPPEREPATPAQDLPEASQVSTEAPRTSSEPQETADASPASIVDPIVEADKPSEAAPVKDGTDAEGAVQPSAQEPESESVKELPATPTELVEESAPVPASEPVNESVEPIPEPSVPIVEEVIEPIPVVLDAEQAAFVAPIASPVEEISNEPKVEQVASVESTVIPAVDESPEQVAQEPTAEPVVEEEVKDVESAIAPEVKPESTPIQEPEPTVSAIEPSPEPEIAPVVQEVDEEVIPAPESEVLEKADVQEPEPVSEAVEPAPEAEIAPIVEEVQAEPTALAASEVSDEVAQPTVKLDKSPIEADEVKEESSPVVEPTPVEPEVPIVESAPIVDKVAAEPALAAAESAPVVLDAEQAAFVAPIASSTIAEPLEESMAGEVVETSGELAEVPSVVADAGAEDAKVTEESVVEESESLSVEPESAPADEEASPIVAATEPIPEIAQDEEVKVSENEIVVEVIAPTEAGAEGGASVEEVEAVSVETEVVDGVSSKEVEPTVVEPEAATATVEPSSDVAPSDDATTSEPAPAEIASEVAEVVAPIQAEEEEIADVASEVAESAASVQAPASEDVIVPAIEHLEVAETVPEPSSVEEIKQEPSEKIEESVVSEESVAKVQDAVTAESKPITAVEEPIAPASEVESAAESVSDAPIVEATPSAPIEQDTADESASSAASKASKNKAKKQRQKAAKAAASEASPTAVFCRTVVATEQPSTSAAIAESEDVNVEVPAEQVTAAEPVQVGDVAPEQSVSEESVEVPAEPISESTPATEPDSVASESITPVEDGASQVDLGGAEAAAASVGAEAPPIKSVELSQPLKSNDSVSVLAVEPQTKSEAPVVEGAGAELGSTELAPKCLAEKVELKGDEVLPAPTLDASEAPATEISSTEAVVDLPTAIEAVASYAGSAAEELVTSIKTAVDYVVEDLVGTHVSASTDSQVIETAKPAGPEHESAKVHVATATSSDATDSEAPAPVQASVEEEVKVVEA